MPRLTDKIDFKTKNLLEIKLYYNEKMFNYQENIKNYNICS